jgi:hypothetical protein
MVESGGFWPQNLKTIKVAGRYLENLGEERN